MNLSSSDFDALAGIVAAAIVTIGLLAGLSVFRSLVELPAWEKINLSGFYEYVRAADLGRGLILYPLIGIVAALLTVLAAIDGYLDGVNSTMMILLWISLILAIAQSITMTRAAPNMLSLRSAPNNPESVKFVYARFKRWQDRRAALQFINFLTIVIAMAVLIA
jgi:hypothetical protein